MNGRVGQDVADLTNPGGREALTPDACDLAASPSAGREDRRVLPRTGDGLAGPVNGLGRISHLVSAPVMPPGWRNRRLPAKAILGVIRPAARAIIAVLATLLTQSCEK